MRLIVPFLIFGFFLLTVIRVCAQTIRGKVTDTIGNAISFANVTLKSRDNVVIAYTSCNEGGAFFISIPASISKEGLMLEAASLGYQKQIKSVTELGPSCNFTLSSSIRELAPVQVTKRRPRLNTQGDTLSYKAGDFSTPQDRVIGDVLKRLPGIQVDGSGKISYNGKAISAFYIDGDNLLDDKYNIATKTVPNQVVDNIQILENHQPVKVLRNKTFSDKVALNITFKKDAKLRLIGQVSSGGGAPGKYDGNINGMTFKNNYKSINYIKANNTGTDIGLDLIAHNGTDASKTGGNAKPPPILSLGTAGVPDLPLERYLLNHALLFNINNLVKPNKETQVKSNLSFLHDKQDQQYQRQEQTFVANDVIANTERQDNRQTIDELNAQADITVNKDNYYLNNTLTGKIDHHLASSILNANNVAFQQQLKEKAFDFSNEFNLMVASKRGIIINFFSNTSRMTRPERNVLGPGLNPHLLKSAVPINQLAQYTDIPGWVTNNYLSVGWSFNRFSVFQKTGISMQNQTFRSDLLDIATDGSKNEVTDSASNNLSWTRTKYYTGLLVDFLSSKVKVSIDMPVLLQQTNYQDVNFQLSNRSSRLYFNPQVTLKYQTGIENYLSLNYSKANNGGNITDVYRGKVLRSYRYLFSNDADLAEVANHSASLGFFYRRAIKLFFFNANVSYRRINSNTITSSAVNTAFIRRVTLPYQNAADNWRVTATLSKYLFFMNATLTLTPSWQVNRFSMVQNNILVPYQTRLQGMNITVESKINKKTDVNYGSYWTQIKSYSATVSNPSFTQLRHHAALSYSPINKMFFKLSADYYMTSQQITGKTGYLFSDLRMRYNLTKQHMDVELSGINLLNATSYSTAYVSGDTFSSSIYKIPGRIVMGRLTFNY